MTAREFSTEAEALEALTEAGPGWLIEPCRWRLRLPSWEEHVEADEFQEQKVDLAFIAFSTRADLMELDDDDLIGLGRMVVDMAAFARRMKGP